MQVSFLLTYLEDSRPQVKINVLKDLKFLGDKGGHLWEASHVSNLIDCVLKEDSILKEDDESMDVDVSVDSPQEAEIRHMALDVIHSLTSSSAILPFVHVSSNYKNWTSLQFFSFKFIFPQILH